MTAGRPSTYKPGDVVEPDYLESHPERLVSLLKEGRLDFHICTEFGISRDTFYRWKKEHPDFLKAYNIGAPACEAYWFKKIEEMASDGHDKGFKPTIAVLNNKFGWGQEEGHRVTSNTQINIQGNVQVLQDKSTEELISLLKDDFSYLQNNNIIPATLIELKEVNAESQTDRKSTKQN